MEINQHEEVLLAQGLLDELQKTLLVLKGKLTASNINLVALKDHILLARTQAIRIEQVIDQIALP